MARNLNWDDMSPQQKLQFARKMNSLTQGLGIGKGAISMVQHQSKRNKRKPNLGPQTEKQKARKMTILTKGLGIGQGANHMVHTQSKRNGRSRNHGDLTLDQAYDLTAELLIRQSGRCWITGTELVINGYADDLRSYSIDRLVDSKGYSVDNCRAVCVWVNTATSQYPRSDQKLTLWRSFQNLPTETTETEYPDFYDYFTDPVCLESALTSKGHRKETKDRIPTWLTYFDLPAIVPFYKLSDQEVLNLLA